MIKTGIIDGLSWEESVAPFDGDGFRSLPDRRNKQSPALGRKDVPVRAFLIFLPISKPTEKNSFSENAPSPIA